MRKSQSASEQTAMQHIDSFGPSPDQLLLIWLIVSVGVLLLGLIYARAINHKEVKTDWITFSLWFGVLSIISLVVYLLF